MSGFAVHLDYARPATPERRAAIASGIAYRGPHRQATRTAGPCTLMHAALWTTPEAEREDQPQRHVTRDFWLAADARVDNREELTAALGSSTRQPLHTDADLILAAYECWGVDVVEHLVGDYAFALWDGEIEELLLARDPFGLRPLFLTQTPSGTIAASTLPSVLAGLDSVPETDESYLAGFLHGMPPRDRSIWAGIERLAPGHRRIIGRDRVATARAWLPSLDESRQPPEDLMEQMRALFDEAVRCRLRTRDGVASDLSGGWDSSTVTATAADLGAVQPVSLVYRSDPEAYELPYIEAVADHLGIKSQLIEADELMTLDPAEDIRAHGEPLYSIDATDTAACFDQVAALGASVSLTGMGGDELLYGGSSSFRDVLRWSLRDSMMRWTSARPQGVVAHLSAFVRTRNARRHRPWIRVPPPRWPEPSPHRGNPAVAARLAGYEGAWNGPAYELTERLAAERGVEVRHPFLDRRLVEFGLRLPASLIGVDGDPRRLHRRLFEHRLPQTVMTRSDKAEFSGSFMRRMQCLGPADAATAIAALGAHVDPAVLEGRHGDGSAAGLLTPRHRWLVLSAGIHSAMFPGTRTEIG